VTTSLQMERDLRPLSEREAEVYVASICFKTGPPGPVGVEIERIVHDAADPTVPVPVPRVRAATVPADRGLPGGGAVSIEPGGQLELSSACAPHIAGLVDATRADLSALDGLLAAAGLRPAPVALDGHRAPVRTLHSPRYDAMQHHFDLAGPAGRTMMCSTAALQVCLDAGLDGSGSHSAVQRWRRLHALLPVLVATFANSPFRDGAPSGWRSGRQAVWLAIDRSRAGPPPPLDDPREAWASYALDAPLLCLPNPSGSWAPPSGLTMRAWLRGNGPGTVTTRDLDYHLTTLFPPVRPRGFLELRAVDAQAGSDWEVATAFVTALVDDETASDRAAEACEAVGASSDPMVVAARDALADPVLAGAARTCAEAVLGSLGRLRADPVTRRRVETFVDRYTSRGRCPADDRLESWARTGRIDAYPDEEAE
jgi:glutamate--cysteine ligase